MTRPPDIDQTPSVAHGGTRHGDYLLVTPREFRELLRLRRQIGAARQALARADLVTGGHAPVPHWLMDDIRAAVL
jgi:hypothetical protein